MIIVSLDRKLRVGSNLSLSIVHHLTVSVDFNVSFIQSLILLTTSKKLRQEHCEWKANLSSPASSRINQSIDRSENVANEKYVNLLL